MLKVIGILVIIVLLIFTVSLIASILFNQKVKKEVRGLLSNSSQKKKETISKADLKGLPFSVQKWLEYSQIIGKNRIKTVRLKQKAVMRLAEGKPWMATEAEQYFITEEPGFIWKAKVKMAPFMYFTGRDKYYEGKGNMLIKLFSLITLADARGKEVDQGTLVRYLAETVWFPTVALNNYITWEEIDSKSAKAIMTYGGITASGIFVFNEKGEVINFFADRYREVNGQYTMETWSIQMKEYKEFDGIKIPTKAEVIWKLKEGDFNWYCLEITKIDYNKLVVY